MKKGFKQGISCLLVLVMVVTLLVGCGTSVLPEESAAEASSVYDATLQSYVGAVPMDGELPLTITITFNGNGGIPEYQEILADLQADNTYVLRSQPEPAIYQSNHFVGWFAISGEFLEVVELSYDGPRTFYARWRFYGGILPMIFDGNGGTPAVQPVVFKAGSDVRFGDLFSPFFLANPSVVTPFHPDGYQFLGWSRTADNDPTAVIPATELWTETTAAQVVYAVWEEEYVFWTRGFRMDFRGNGGMPTDQLRTVVILGSGNDPILITFDDLINWRIHPAVVTPVREGYRFLGWSNTEDGSTGIIAPNRHIFPLWSDPWIVWAQWEVSIGHDVGMSPPAAIRDIFPDEQLAESVALALGETVDAVVTQADLNQLQALNINHRDVESLEGVQYLRELGLLQAWDNQIRDLSPLSGLSSLTSLNLGHNQISDMEPFSGFSGFSGFFNLVLEHNQISDVTPLTHVVVSNLWLSDNQIRDITPLRYTDLSVARNQITDFTGTGNHFLHGALLHLDGRDQQTVLEPILRTETISIANMVRYPWPDPLRSYDISDGGVYENGMITWTGLTTQEFVSFSWSLDPAAFRNTTGEITVSVSNERPQCNFCCVGWPSIDPMFQEASGTVIIPLISPGSENNSPIQLNHSGVFAFSPRSVGEETSSLITTIRNTGNASSGILAVRFSGGNANSFEFTDISCPSPRVNLAHSSVFRSLWTVNGTAFVIPNMVAGEEIEFILRPRLNLPAGRHTTTVTVSGRGVSESFDVVIVVR